MNLLTRCGRKYLKPQVVSRMYFRETFNDVIAESLGGLHVGHRQALSW
ncbi:hypothetical protein HMPREF0281_01186 [Corynebacterium ammoniagenes DSM 20306]|uniref:Uncharacterized protein n=1 Tax=Corynebacterium ammoniagenes DSM 20306 TaxID=649754 RepID=A0ABN0AEZ0_CORAM|nr:hypothetical protein HMPREF0281_01186 [Corynebacterium ammoniagenes DSM 20306]